MNLVFMILLLSLSRAFDESTEESFNNSYRDTVTNTFQEVYSD